MMFPIKSLVIKKKQQWRPSRLEAKDGIFQYVKVSDTRGFYHLNPLAQKLHRYHLSIQVPKAQRVYDTVSLVTRSRFLVYSLLSYFFQCAADIQAQYHRKKEKYFELGLNVGPQLFAVSPDEDYISECYTVINNTTYNLGGPLKAFDIFFKAFHALNLCYPKESEREMYFIQKSVFNIDCECDKTIRDCKSMGMINNYTKFKSTS